MGIAEFYGRPVATATALLAVVVVSGALLWGARLGPSANSEGAAFTVIIEQFGVDAAEIERTITRPLEDSLGSLPGLKSIRSVSDYGSARVTIYLQTRTSARDAYLRLRDDVDRLYSQLPGSVQRPRIVSSVSEGRAFFIASARSRSMGVQELATLLERELQPALETIDGAGEVEVGGSSPREIHVVLDEQRVSRAGLDAASIARAIQSAEMLTPLGHVIERGYELAVVLRGRLGSLDALRAVRVPLGTGERRGAAPDTGPGLRNVAANEASWVTLGSVATVSYGSRERDEISRVDGKENAVVAIRSSGSANLVELSRAIRAELRRFESRGLQFGVILDEGAELQESLASILEAILFAVIVAALTLPLFLSGARRVVVIAVSIPVIGLASAAVVSAAGMNMDTYVLSGLAVGIGTMIDTGIILAGRAVRGADQSSYFREAVRLMPALLASCLTALIVLVPLMALELGTGGIREVSLALGALMGVSFVLSCLFVPAYAIGARARSDPPAFRKRSRPRLLGSLRRTARRFAQTIIARCAARRRWPLIGGGVVAAAGLWAVSTIGIDLEPPLRADSIPVHVECESGASIESVDARVVSFTERIRRLPGVTVLQSTARRGSAEIQVGFDPRQAARESLSSAIREMGREMPGGFAYLPEGAGSVERTLEIAVTGENEKTLKDYATQAAKRLGSHRSIKEVVLNFKEPADSYIFSVDPRRAAAAGTDTEAVAGALRWHLYGPVALKWIGDEQRGDREAGNHEMDLRVMGRRASPTPDELARVPVPTSGARSLPAEVTGSFSVVQEGGKLYRLNRQRAVYLTTHVEAGDIRAIVRGVEQTLNSVALAPGYAFQVGQDLVEQAERFRMLWFTFAMCIILVYLVLGVLTESFVWPLAILAVLPASITLPLIIMRLAGQRLVIPVLIGLIVLSGMAVNNSILIVDAYRARRDRGAGGVTRAVLSRLSALTATSAATVLGHVPLLFAAGEGAAFMRSLAFVIIWGIVGSYAATVLVIPAVIGGAAERRARLLS